MLRRVVLTGEFLGCGYILNIRRSSKRMVLSCDGTAKIWDGAATHVD